MNSCSKRPRDRGNNSESDLNVSSASIPQNENHDFHSLVAGIQSSLTTKQRLSVLNKLRKFLQKKQESGNDNSYTSSVLTNHVDNQLCNLSSSHNESVEDFLSAGGLNALILQLNHLVHSHGATLPELELLCYCISLVFRFIRRSKDLTESVVCDQGSNLLVLLSNASLLASQKRHGPNLNPLRSIPSIQHTTMAIFYIVTSSSTGSTLFLKCQVAIEMVAHILADTIIDDDSAYEAIGVYKNLTYYQEESRIKLMKSARFIQSLACNNKMTSIKGRQRQIAVIRNLATSVECRSLLVSQPAIVGILIQSLLWEPDPNFAEDVSDMHSLRRNAFVALVSLSMDHESALLLIFYGDGILLRILKRFLNNSMDTFLRKKSVCVLRLLANEVSAPLLVHDADLMHSLSDAALRDNSLDVRREAAEAFARCAAFVQLEQQPHFDNVLDALTVLIKGQSPTKTMAINSLARALKEQSFHASNQRPMAKRGVLLEAIAQIALLRGVDSASAATDACCALMNLSSDEENIEKLSSNSTVLEALLSNASFYATNFADRKAHALTALVNMTQLTICRQAMIRHGCLLQTLIQEAKFIPMSQISLKKRLKQAILLLALEL